MTAAACGTRSGYNAHLRRGVVPCDDCKAANLAHVGQCAACGGIYDDNDDHPNCPAVIVDRTRTSTPAHEDRRSPTLGAVSEFADIVTERAAIYGDPAILQTMVAGVWAAYLNGDMPTAHDVAWMMTLLKACRSKVNPQHGDNYVDAKGYIDIAEGLA